MTSYIIKIIFFLLILVCPTTGMAQEESNDQNIGRAEKMFTFVLQDQADSLYENMSDKVKSMVQKHQLQGSVIVFDTQRKMLGIQFVPESAVKKE